VVVVAIEPMTFVGPAGLSQEMRANEDPWPGTREECALVVCDVGAIVDPDVVTVDALARLQLTARRLGRQLRLRDACVELQELLAFVGLGEVMPLCSASPLEPRGQAEQREQARRVQEEADPGDPTARYLEDLQRPRLEAAVRAARLVLPVRR
jgi:hypothetical protein